MAKDHPDQIKKKRHAELLIRQGRLEEAENIYRELITENTNDHIVYGNLAALYGKQGKTKELILLLKKSLQINPNYQQAHYNLGMAYKQKGDFKAAITSFKKSLSINPNHLESLYNAGTVLQKIGDTSGAIDCYIKTLKLNPNHTNANINLGNTLKIKGDFDAAITSYNKAIALDPRRPDIHNNLGIALKLKGDLDAAINCYKTALKLNPEYPDANINYGNAIKLKGDPDTAIHFYKKALKNSPNHPDAHWNIALAMLLQGDYINGWKKYEWRFKHDSMDNPHAMPICKIWNGNTLKEKNRLLLVSEQGLGDTLQFMRYAITLRHQGINVSICAQPKLHSLIQSSEINHYPLTPHEANRVNEGHWVPLLSVPRYLNVTPQNPISNDPYITPSKTFLEKWASIFAHQKKPIVGINWRGNRDDYQKKDRNLPLKKFKQIIDGLDICLISLQRGVQTEERAELWADQETPIFQSDLDRLANSNKSLDFNEYAAVVANFDLVISTSTTMAHLAAGIGKTTWILLPKIPDWRWGLKGEECFWYPTMRLFRQHEYGNWDHVIQKTREELKTFISQKEFNA